jgi:hypothetical protein
MTKRAAELAERYQWSRQRQIYGGVVNHLLDGAADGRTSRRRIVARRKRFSAGTEFAPPRPR